MEIENRIYELILDIVGDKKVLDGVTYETELLQSEIIESLVIAQLAVEIEKVFSINEIDYEDFTPENFSSIEAIANLVRRYMGEETR